MKNVHLLLGILMLFSVTATIIPVEVNPTQPAYKNRVNNFTFMNFFLAGINLGTTTDTTPGNIRFTNSQFQGWNGSEWLALSGNGSADTTCEDSSCDLSDDTGYLFTNLDFTATTGFDDLVDNDTLSALSCSNDQIAKYNTSSGAWYCASDSTSGIVEESDPIWSDDRPKYLNYSRTESGENVTITFLI